MELLISPNTANKHANIFLNRKLNFLSESEDEKSRGGTLEIILSGVCGVTDKLFSMVQTTSEVDILLQNFI